MTALSIKKNNNYVLLLLLTLLSLHIVYVTLLQPIYPLMSGVIVDQIAYVVGSLLILVGLSQIARDSLPFNERLFWLCMTTAFMVWMVTKSILLAGALLALPDWLLVFEHYGSFVFFLAIIFSTQFLDSGKTLKKPEVMINIALDTFGATIFVGSLFIYLIIVPDQLINSQDSPRYSVFLFYIMANVYLATVFLSNALRSRHSDRRHRFLWLSFTFILFLISESIGTASRLQFSTLPLEPVGSVFSIIPYLTLAVAFRPMLVKRPVKAYTIPLWTPSILAIHISTLLFLHLLGHHYGWFDDEFQSLRETVIIIWIGIYLIGVSIFEKHKRGTTKASESVLHSTHEPLAVTSGQLDSIPSPVFILNGTGHVNKANEAACKLTGYSESQLLDEMFTGLLHKDEPLIPLLRFSEPWFSVAKLFPFGSRKIRIQHKNGTTLVCYISMEALQDRFCVSLTNISRLHDAEQQALSIKDKFLANITHEFRTPLTIIQGALEESIESSPNTALKKQLLSAKSNVARLLKMVEQLLTLSKITSAPKLALVVKPASEIIKVCCLQFEPLCQHKSIAFSFHVQESLWIKVHEDSLQVLLYNLLSNAYKYSEQNGQISLIAQQEHQNLLITIADSGCGMTQDDLKRLFKRFQRSESAERSSTFGVGLGLSVVSELVQMHEWQIDVKSIVAQGTEFKLTLPLTEAPENTSVDINPITFEPEESKSNAAQFPPPHEHLTPVASTDNQQERLLIIEDNLDMQDYLRHLMSPIYQTDIVGYGKEGIETATREVPDVIICDLLLPDINGYEVIEYLKQQSATQHIPILMLTAKDDIQSKLKGLEKCADDYLTKPFHHKELKLRVQNLLEIRQNMQAMLRQHLNVSTVKSANKNELQNLKPTPEMAQHHEFIEQLQGLAERYYSLDSFGVTHLVENMALSERQLQRKLKATLNLTPSEYIREYRLIKSKEILLQGKNVGVVAGMVGFSDQAYFTRCFKLKNGQTPSEYQKAHA